MNGLGQIRVDAKDPTPLYAQLEREIMAAIATGHLPSGSQLPTVRQLAVDLRVNANTVARVYTQLERAGVLETRRGVGTFVAGRLPVAGADSAARDAALFTAARGYLAAAAAAGASPDQALAQLRAIVGPGLETDPSSKESSLKEHDRG
ncbi:MAG: GntR family transcriptional regulator [Vicinamibacterales bacterium]